MAVHQAQDEQRLIAKYVDASWGTADARLRRVGVSVWSLIGYLQAFDGDAEQVRLAFGLSPEEMESALAYYNHHRRDIDARLLLNSA